MRKLLLITVLLLCSTSYSYSQWYGNHIVSFSASSGITLCDSDGDATGWSHPVRWEHAPADNNSPSSLVPHDANETLVPAPGGMRCLYWDAAGPDSLDISFPSLSPTDTLITVRARDRGGAGINEIYLYQSHNWWTYTEVQHWDNIGAANNAFVEQTWTRSRNPGSSYQYRIDALDAAGNRVSYTSPDTLEFVPLEDPIITSPTHSDWVWSTNDDPTLNISPSVYENYYCIDTTNTCNPNTGWDTRTYNNIGNNEYYFRAKTCAGWPTWICTDIVWFDLRIDDTLALPPTIDSPTHDDNIWNNNNDPSFTITPGPSASPTIESYCIDQANTCTPDTEGNSPSFANLPDGIHYVRSHSCKFSGCSDVEVFILRIDTIAPSAADISSISPLSDTNHLATDSQSFSLSVSDGGWSPISIIHGFFENFATRNSYITVPFTSTSDNNPAQADRLTISPSIQDVDGDGSPDDGTREYSYKITRICDDAGNCNVVNDNPSQGRWIIDYSYNVFANTSDIILEQVLPTNIANLEDDNNVADGNNYSLTVQLQDRYGNGIISAPSIGRQIDIDIDAQNTVYLNQYTRTGDSAAFIAVPDSSVYNPYPIGNSIQSYSDLQSSDGNYEFSFRLYTPTYQYRVSHGADPSSQFLINTISYSVSDTIPEPWDTTGNVVLGSDGNIDFAFLPMFSNLFSGDLENDDFEEDNLQRSSIAVDKNSSRPTGNAINRQMYLKYNGQSAAINSYRLDYGTNASTSQTVATGATLESRFPSGAFLPTTYNNLYTRLEQVGWAPIDALDSAFLSTHMSYRIDGYDVVINGDVIGKDNYHGIIPPSDTNYAGVKIIGTSNADTAQEYITGQFSDDVRIIWRLIKSSFRRDIRKKAFELVRSVTPNNGANRVSDFSGTSGWNNTDGARISAGQVLYFGNLTNDYVELGNSLSQTVAGNKTLVAQWGDIYITSDLQYSDRSRDILWVIALEDANGNGGNIYVHPDVTDISAVLYADRAVMTAIDSDNSGSISGTEVFDGTSDPADFSDQLYIYGSVFSENTIGWARSIPRECPYYVAICDTAQTAERYDLNYLRRYVLEDHDSDPGTPDIPAFGWQSSRWSGIYREYPLIIEYNSLIQSSPPPLFK